MMKMSLRDARLHGMRGNLDSRSLSAPPQQEPVIPEPTEQPEAAPLVAMAMEKVANAMASIEVSGRAQSAAILAALEVQKQPSAAATPVRWTFRVTKRDAKGNVEEFVAEPTASHPHRNRVRAVSGVE